MVPMIIAGIAVAGAGQCGELVAADSLREMVTVLQHRHLYVTCEGPDERVPVRMRLPLGVDALSAAKGAIAGCSGCSERFEAVARGERVEIRQIDGARLLDTVVQLQPGNRLLSEVAAELETQLGASEYARDKPLVGVNVRAHPSRRVVVPDLVPVAAREWVAALEVVSFIATKGVNPDERVAWRASQTPSTQMVALHLVDLRVPDEPPDPIPGFETRSAVLERMKAEGLDNPAPDMTPADIAEAAARMDVLIAEALAFEAEAARPCDP